MSWSQLKELKSSRTNFVILVVSPGGVSYNGLAKGAFPAGEESSSSDLIYDPEGGIELVQDYTLDTHFRQEIISNFIGKQFNIFGFEPRDCIQTNNTLLKIKFSIFKV